MKFFSKNRIDTINEILKNKDIDKKEYINYYFPFFLYHNSWKNINKSNFVGNETLFKGYLLREFCLNTVPTEEYEWTRRRIKII